MPQAPIRSRCEPQKSSSRFSAVAPVLQGELGPNLLISPPLDAQAGAAIAPAPPLFGPPRNPGCQRSPGLAWECQPAAHQDAPPPLRLLYPAWMPPLCGALGCLHRQHCSLGWPSEASDLPPFCPEALPQAGHRPGVLPRWLQVAGPGVPLHGTRPKTGAAFRLPEEQAGQSGLSNVTATAAPQGPQATTDAPSPKDIRAQTPRHRANAHGCSWLRTSPPGSKDQGPPTPGHISKVRTKGCASKRHVPPSVSVPVGGGDASHAWELCIEARTRNWRVATRNHSFAGVLGAKESEPVPGIRAKDAMRWKRDRLWGGGT